MTTALPAWLQIAWALTAILIALGAVGWALFALLPYMRITKAAMIESLELGRGSAKVLKSLEAEVKPLVADLREIVGDVKTLIGDIKEQRPGRIVEFLEKLEKDGSIEKIAQSIEVIAKKAHGALEGSGKEGAVVNVPEFPPGLAGAKDWGACAKCGHIHHELLACFGVEAR